MVADSALGFTSATPVENPFWLSTNMACLEKSSAIGTEASLMRAPDGLYSEKTAVTEMLSGQRTTLVYPTVSGPVPSETSLTVCPPVSVQVCERQHGSGSCHGVNRPTSPFEVR